MASSADSGVGTTDGAGPRAVAGWFGPRERRCFAWVHVPRGDLATGAVVLCPPLGKEVTSTYSTYRRVAHLLAERGMLAVRIAYDGTGDSAGGDDDPGRVAAWLSSIEHAVELAKSSGTESVFLLGMRMGALLAAWAAATGEHVERLVLWDPCESGKSFLREGRAMALLHADGARGRAPSGRIDLPGWTLRADTADDLRRLGRPLGGAPTVRRVLALVRPGSPPSWDLTSAFETAAR